MKIGILGGTFDPPHVGHTLLAEYVREECALDEIWLAVANDPPHKLGVKKTPVAQRLEMTELACDGYSKVKASDCDIKHGRHPSYTYDLLTELSQQYEQYCFTLVIGADSVINFTTWHRWDELLAKFEVLAVRRPNYNLAYANQNVLDHVRFVEAPLIELSSISIRARVAQGKSIHYIVSSNVEKFIIENKLYQTLVEY